ncbi:hypothetical protein BH23GEM6_BH23GEM6_04440 [soil metagenome]
MSIVELSQARELLRNHEEDEVVLDPNDPYPGAEEFIRRHHMAEEVRTLHEQAGEFYRWTGSHYRLAEDTEVRAELWNFTAKALRPEKAEGKKDYVLVPFKPTTAKVNNLLDATRAQAHLPVTHRAPCWIGSDSKTVPPDELIALENGLLHVGSRDLLPHSPRFYTHNALGFTYRPGAVPEPVQWLRFLNELWPDDPEAIAVLQEIIGYLLTADTRLQKAFLLVGPKRSGKGTIARIIRELLGESNVCAPTLSGLSMNFGLQPLIGKLLAIISDARLSSRADQAAIAERLLAISGEDAITVDRKHKASWTGKLSTRFLILTNELPRLADSSGALASRFVVLTLERSFYGHEDPLLTDRLMVELPGIFEWALDGWDRLTERGHFIQPASSQDAVREMEDLGSPIGAFIRERCHIGPGRTIECRALYESWKSWCQAEGRDHAGTAQTFGRDLRAAIPGLKTSSLRVGEGRSRFYEGVELRLVF